MESLEQTKAPPSNHLGELKMDSILTRATLSGQPVVFLLDTLNMEKGSISMWPVNEAEPHTVNLDTYRNTRPVPDALEEQMINQYQQKFQPKGGVILRKRLYKDREQAARMATASHASVNVPHEPILHSVSNLHQQQREASPEAATKPRMTLEQWDKAAFVDRVMNAFTVALGAALKEAMK